jgi:hypothetical protein
MGYGRQILMVTGSFAERPSVSETLIVVPGGPFVVSVEVTTNVPGETCVTVAIDVFSLTALNVPE